METDSWVHSFSVMIILNFQKCFDWWTFMFSQSLIFIVHHVMERKLMKDHKMDRAIWFVFPRFLHLHISFDLSLCIDPGYYFFYRVSKPLVIEVGDTGQGTQNTHRTPGTTAPRTSSCRGTPRWCRPGPGGCRRHCPTSARTHSKGGKYLIGI